IRTRQKARAKRPEQAGRREPRERAAVPSQHPRDGKDFPFASECGAAEETPGSARSRGQQGYGTRTGWFACGGVSLGDFSGRAYRRNRPEHQGEGETRKCVRGWIHQRLHLLRATAKQRNNTGYAQEDCDSLVSPDWQEKFETKAVEMLKGL